MSKIRKIVACIVKKPENFFLALCLIFGALFIIVTPPFQAPDEIVHFYRAYQVSELNLIVDREQGVVGGVLPNSLGETVNLTTLNPDIQFVAANKYQTGKSFEALSIKHKPNEKTRYEFSATALYSPVSYFPQSLGLAIGRLLGVAPLLMMYIGRFLNLAAWGVLIWASIKIIPRKKWAVVAIGLLPMAIFQASSLSTDVMSSGLAVLFIATIFYLLGNKKITTKQVLCLAVIMIALVLSKHIMTVLLLLVFLLPANSFRSKQKEIIIKLLLIILPIILLSIWISKVGSIDLEASYTNNQDPSKQIEFIARNPHSYVNVLWNTHFFSWGDSVTRSFIGTFGWMDAPMAESLTVVGYIGLFLVMVANEAPSKFKEWLKKRQKALIGITAVGFWLVVNTALYVVYSPVGFKIIYGLQGRYFIPIAMLMIPLFYSRWLSISRKTHYYLVRVYPIFMLISGLLTAYYRYYINNV